MTTVNNVVVNELLTFIQNKLDVLDELSVVQICSSNYTDEEIENAKTKLYSMISDGSRCVTRKGEDKKKKNLKDILKLFKETDPDKHPQFVAKDLNRLPPVTFDHVDVSRLLKDLTQLKSELNFIKDNWISKDDVKIIHDELKLIRLANRPTNKSTPKQSKGINSRPIKSPQPKVSYSCTPNLNERLSMNESPASPPPQPVSASAASAMHATENGLSTPTYRDIIVSSLSSRHPSQDKVVSKSTNIRNVLNDDFKTVLSHKKRKRLANMRGTLENFNRIRVAESTTRIYVSRFSKDVSEDDIQNHILDMGEECRSISLLKQNHETAFNSFKIEVPSGKLEKFLRGDFWPAGLVFRRYKERYVPNDPTKKSR